MFFQLIQTGKQGNQQETTQNGKTSPTKAPGQTTIAPVQKAPVANGGSKSSEKSSKVCVLM